MAPITVYIVDDDTSVRQALGRLVQSAGMRAEVFATVPELMGLGRLEEPACVIVDICMPVSGLELPGLLARHGHRLPVIFVTAYDSEHHREAARRAGAVGFFHKPIDGQALSDAIIWAVAAAGDRTSPKPEPFTIPPKPMKYAMKKKRLLLMLTGLAVIAAVPLQALAQTEKPNILMIMSDDVGITNISGYSRGMAGYHTPNIDRIASEGVLFTDYYAEQSCTAGRQQGIAASETPLCDPAGSAILACACRGSLVSS